VVMYTKANDVTSSGILVMIYTKAKDVTS